MIPLPPQFMLGWQTYVNSYEEFLVSRGLASEKIVTEVQELIDVIVSTKEFEGQIWDAIKEVYRLKTIAAPKVPPQHSRIIVAAQNASPEPIIIKTEPNLSTVKNEPVFSAVPSEQETLNAVRVKKRKRGDGKESAYMKKKKMNEQFQMMQSGGTVKTNENGHAQVPYVVNVQQQIRMQPQQQAPSQLQHLLQVQPPKHAPQQIRLTPQQQTILRMRLQQQQKLQERKMQEEQKIKEERKMQEEKLKQELRMELQQHSEQMVQQQVQAQPQPQQQQQYDYAEYQQGGNYSQQQYNNYSPVSGNVYLNQQFNYPPSSGMAQQQFSPSRAQMQSPTQNQNFVQPSTSPYPHVNHQY